MHAAFARLKGHFTDLTDPHRREVTYSLINIVTIAACAVSRPTRSRRSRNYWKSWHSPGA